MSKKFTTLEIDRLKREAKRLSRNSKIPLNEALAQIASREGYRGWELLVRAEIIHPIQMAHTHGAELKPDEGGRIGDALTAHILANCVQFINDLNDDDVFRACWSGSIWIQRQDVLAGTVGINSFQVLGPCQDSYWQDIGQSRAMTCLLNLDGLAENFILEGDIDDDGEPVKPNHLQQLYSPKTGRSKLIETLKYSIQSEISRIEVALM